jgi:hypothetical protein
MEIKTVELPWTMTTNELAQDLLTKLSNALYERENNKIEICFSIKEVQMIEEWINFILKL